MKRAFRLALLLLVAVVATAGLFVTLHAPARRPTGDLRVEVTPERLERGRYLFEHLAACVACHTERDVSTRNHSFIGPKAAGGECFTREMGFPGHVCAPNITPDADTGVGAWTDDELLRAIREGIGRDGRALFPIMPYGEYKNMPDEDAYAVIAYLRRLDPVRNQTPAAEIDFPVSFFIEFEPEPVEHPVPALSFASDFERGRYLAGIASCRGCHGEDLSGGEEFPLPSIVVRASNLTPGADGILPAAADDFVRLFHTYAEGSLPEGVSTDDLTAMPWPVFGGIIEEDLRAIHAYLRSLPAVAKQVQTYGPAQ